ncbi:MAG: sugar transferase [Pseudomonadota bacterium]
MRHFLWLALSVFAIILGASVMTFAYNRMDGLFRSLPILHLMTAVIALAAGRVCVVIWHRRLAVTKLTGALHSVRCEGHPSALVVGRTSLAEAYLRAFLETSCQSFAIAGVVDSGCPSSGRDVLGFPLLGRVEELELILADLETRGVLIDRLIVAARPSDMSQDAQGKLSQFEQAGGRRVDHLFDLLGLDGSGLQTFADPVANTSLQNDLVSSSKEDNNSMTCSADQALLAAVKERSFWLRKRWVDFCLALLLLLMLSPIVVFAACLVLLDVGWPIIFWQVRPGRSGQPLRLYKLRTMKPSRNQYGSRLTDKERVSIIGSFLRRSRMDELPQLFNILLGEMSFVGPRPLLPIDQPAGFPARLAVPPGLTGWAQVQSVRSIAAVDKAALDIWYIQNASFALDLWIVLKTIPIVLFGERTNHNAIARSWYDLEKVGFSRATDAIDDSA